ncbi:MAG TPA: S-adenosylmethionine:tRNA ribosyltransferase-isomerase, partial [Elusimicrobiales bacterium]|nr:S-adenosylmethionine:tRNA ribosyltransferase-isomerase [Elusimicrobiales bacterium]
FARSHGDIPLPKYILKARGLAAKNLALDEDKSAYQTVYARAEGSVAAPTAGFHFTPQLLDGLKNSGVKTASLTLHVGWGTFKMLKTAPQAHVMPPETATLDAAQAELINSARKAGGRIFSVGTTSTRTLETFSDDNGTVSAASRPTGIFIYPPYRFKAVDALLTNFHLPDSTPLYLAAAFCGSWEMLYEAYRKAVEIKYRFYSYGDAMLIYE